MLLIFLICIIFKIKNSIKDEKILHRDRIIKFHARVPLPLYLTNHNQ